MKFLKKFIKKYFSSFAYFYMILRSRLLVVILLSILIAFLDSIGLTMFLPLLQMSDSEGGGIDMGNLQFITDAIQWSGVELTIPKTLLLLVCVFLLKGFVLYKANIYKVKTQQILTKSVRMSIVEKFPVFRYNQFVQTDIGKIQNIFLGEVGRLAATYKNYISMMQGLVMIVVYMVFSFLIDWQFALMVCAGGILSNLVFNKINKLTKEKSKDISKVGNQFAGVLIQYIQNFKYLKATGKILQYGKTIETTIDNVQHTNLQMAVLNTKVSSFREPMLVCIVALVILFQITLFDTKISAILISLLIFYRALTSVVMVQSNYNDTLANQGAIDNITGFLNEISLHKEKIGLQTFTGFNQSIKLDNIVFKYDDTVVLNGITLEIPKNKTVAFVGESGSGKTTLVNILTRLLHTNRGSFKIDDQDISDFNQFTYQNKIGYISQESVIFNDTIFNNVTFWDEPSSENIIKFEEALKKSSIFEFVDSLKHKENTRLGNNGINLSGGQRQRISIARELYKNVEILFLDEATSALDSETELEIKESIDRLKGKTTIIIIAHRLSTIKNADVVYLLDKGIIIGEGSFDKLTESSERFKKMVELQEL
ncbi:MAG: ABC transporter ATP-binding protein [Flavobacteriaceae bacterium]|jgi:subfamily B ATP-binding cassette protein MsbA|nr:ABC transporter ATP-binding protein [Flavobacteriaceae bacterium]